MTLLSTGHTDSWVAPEYIPVAAPAVGERKVSISEWGYAGPVERWDYMGRPKAMVTREAEHLVPILETMMSWAIKPAQWFGSTQRPTVRTMQRAIDVLATNRFSGPLPVVRPTEDGGVQFEWGDRNEGVEIEVLCSGTIVVMTLRGDAVTAADTDDIRAPEVREVLGQVGSL